MPGAEDDPANICSACGGSLPRALALCLVERKSQRTRRWRCRSSPVQFRPSITFNHHYHHFVPGPGAASGAPLADSDPSASSDSPRPRSTAPRVSHGGRAEAAGAPGRPGLGPSLQHPPYRRSARLYAADATLIRSSLPPVRSLPAIREFLISLLECRLRMWRWNRSASK